MTVVDILLAMYSWWPFILMVGGSTLAMRVMRQRTSSGATMIDLYEQQIAETRRTNAGLERIAAALELGIGRAQSQVDEVAKPLEFAYVSARRHRWYGGEAPQFKGSIDPFRRLYWSPDHAGIAWMMVSWLSRSPSFAAVVVYYPFPYHSGTPVRALDPTGIAHLTRAVNPHCIKKIGQ